MSLGLRYRLDRPGQTPTILLSLAFEGRHARLPTKHLALAPNAWLAATSHANVPAPVHGGYLPFVGAITEWPLVRRRVSPRDRRAEIATVSVAVLPIGPFASLADSLRIGDLAGVGRLDLWAPGCDLSEAKPLIAGLFSVTDRTESGAFTVELTERGYESDSVFPGGASLTRDEFGDSMPDGVAGFAKRSLVLGPFPERLSCVPLNGSFPDLRGATQFYVAEPAVQSPPTSVQIGGYPIPMTGIRFVSDRTVSARQSYTRMVLPRPANEYGSSSTDVSCSGGVGLVHTDPVSDLLAIAGYAVTAETRLKVQAATRRGMNMSVFVSGLKGSIWELVAARLAPQLGLMLTSHLGKVTAYDVKHPTSFRRLERGAEIVDGALGKPATADASKIVNAIEMEFGRDVYASSGLTVISPTGNPLVRATSSSPGVAGRKLLASEMRYGRRPQTIQAADIVTLEGARYLAEEVLAPVLSIAGQQYKYWMTWGAGLDLDFDTGLEIVDPVYGATIRARILELSYPPGGVSVLCESIE